jgi:uncharacterized protein (TIGR04255 family)
MIKKSPTKINISHENKVYSNPTIAEAICEIHFECNPLQSAVTDTISKSLKNMLISDYPKVTEQQFKQFHASISDMGVTVNEEKINTNRLVFKHKDRNHIIQFLPNILTINEIERYPGWKVFFKDISHGWEALNSGYPSVSVKRIGLRYINLIPRKNISESLSAWLKPNIYYPSAILNSSKSFLSRNEFDLENDRRLIVTLSEPNQKDMKGNIIFDIDVVLIFKDKNMDLNGIKNHLEELHDMVWKVFSTSISSKYEDLLNGELL